MGILLTKIRISNFRSIESMSLDLGMSNLLIGQNNTGKSNFLRAINIAIAGATDVSENDIFVTAGELLEKTKIAVIDTMFQPIDINEKLVSGFSDFWTGVFTDTWITTHNTGNFVAIRTEIKLDPMEESYFINRRCIRQWGESAETAQLDPKKPLFNENMRKYLQSTYMDANRDIVNDMRNRKSYFGRVTSSYDISEERIRRIEEQLSSVNSMIIESIPALRQTKEKLAAISDTIGDASITVEIESLARRLSDLNKGMDIVMKDSNSASFPISQHGSGTRSWISFLTLSAFVDNQNEKIKKNGEEAEQYFMLTMEEPEAHLHPQAQRQLFSQINSFTGQKIISTHSSSIVAHSALADAIYFSKRDGRTSAVRYRTDANAPKQGKKTPDEKIVREVINTRADILFATAVVLCEGITEELALPVFFHEYFGCSPYSHGVSFIGIGGLNYKTYLSLIKDFEISWYIFSDGEQKAIKSVKSAVRAIFDKDYSTPDNVVILDNGNTYEQYLIQEGYSDIIIEAVCEYEDDDNYLDTYMEHKQGQERKKNMANKLGKGTIRDYTVSSGRTDALLDLCLENKTEYALPVAKKIIAQFDVAKRIPPKIETLLSLLSARIGIDRVAAGEDANEIIS